MNKILVTVFPSLSAPVWRPDTKSAPSGEVLPLAEALDRAYTTDAHMASYVAGGHRLTKGREYPTPPMTHVLFADVDNHAHASWTEETLAAWIAWHSTLPALSTCVVYATINGWRIVQPLEAPIPSTEAEPTILAWYEELRAVGIAVDFACKGWTHLMRLPHWWHSTSPYRARRVATDGTLSSHIVNLGGTP